MEVGYDMEEGGRGLGFDGWFQGWQVRQNLDNRVVTQSHIALLCIGKPDPIQLESRPNYMPLVVRSVRSSLVCFVCTPFSYDIYRQKLHRISQTQVKGICIWIMSQSLHRELKRAPKQLGTEKYVCSPHIPQSLLEDQYVPWPAVTYVRLP